MKIQPIVVKFNIKTTTDKVYQLTLNDMKERIKFVATDENKRHELVLDLEELLAMCKNQRGQYV